MRLSTRFPLILFLFFVLAGCDSGAVVFAPTPLPPDLSPVTVLHPSGVFSMAAPPHWGAYIQDSGTVISMSFSPPGYDIPVLTAAVIQLGGDISDTTQIVADYQTLHRPDLRRYTETARDNLPDGSWRFGGVRILSDGKQLPLNTFIRIDGTFVSVVETIVPDDEDLRAELERAVNTLSIDPAASLPPAELSALSFVHTSSLEVQNTAAWTNPTGVLFVTGEVANYTAEAIARMPVRVSLLDADQNVLIEASDVAMGYQVAAGGFAPFSLRFGQGQPVDAVGYRVTMGDQPSGPPDRPIVGAPVLQWTDESLFTAEGHLLVSGTVTNTGNQTARDPMALVTVFDGSGDVIGAWYQALATREISPGTSIDYEIRVLELGGGARNYIVDIQAYAE
jgi:hypothetical protein